VAIFAPREQLDIEGFLKLSCLNAEIGFGCVKVFCGSPKSLVFHNREQVPEMTKLSPVVHGLFSWR
jgi:hypothetical protein